MPDAPTPNPYTDVAPMVLRFALMSVAVELGKRGIINAHATEYFTGMSQTTAAAGLAAGTLAWSWFAKTKLATRVAHHFAQQKADATGEPASVPSPTCGDDVKAMAYTRPFGQVWYTIDSDGIPKPLQSKQPLKRRAKRKPPKRK